MVSDWNLETPSLCRRLTCFTQRSDCIRPSVTASEEDRSVVLRRRYSIVSILPYKCVLCDAVLVGWNKTRTDTSVQTRVAAYTPTIRKNTIRRGAQWLRKRTTSENENYSIALDMWQKLTEDRVRGNLYLRLLSFVRYDTIRYAVKSTVACYAKRMTDSFTGSWFGTTFYGSTSAVDTYVSIRAIACRYFGAHASWDFIGFNLTSCSTSKHCQSMRQTRLGVIKTSVLRIHEA